MFFAAEAVGHAGDVVAGDLVDALLVDAAAVALGQEALVAHVRGEEVADDAPGLAVAVGGCAGCVDLPQQELRRWRNRRKVAMKMRAEKWSARRKT